MCCLFSYIADHLQYISYDENGKYNNCSVFTDDPFFVKEQWKYSEVCLDSASQAVKDSRFCSCVWAYRTLFDEEVGANLYAMTAHIIALLSDPLVTYREHPDTGHFMWEERWSFVNSLLFCMTTLTLIGELFIL